YEDSYTSLLLKSTCLENLCSTLCSNVRFVFEVELTSSGWSFPLSTFCSARFVDKKYAMEKYSIFNNWSKWIKGLRIKADTLNLIEKKVWNSLEHIGTGDNFLNKTSIDN
ncbi:hypothetical protein STEG23_034249, partial [Scotinomys teguina]